MSWIFRPEAAFRLGPVQVLIGQVVRGQELVAGPLDVTFYADQHSPKAITIVGTSTASEFEKARIDYRYTGPEISMHEISPDSIVTDLSYEEATRLCGRSHDNRAVSGSSTTLS